MYLIAVMKKLKKPKYFIRVLILKLISCFQISLIPILFGEIKANIMAIEKIVLETLIVRKKIKIKKLTLDKKILFYIQK